MAKIRRTVRVELTDEERETIRRASQILDELAGEKGADDVFEIMDNFEDELDYIACALDKLVKNSD